MLTPEQQETHALVRRALGDAMADRYEDWCDLTSGAIRFRVSQPLIGHMIREFESMLRGALRTPFEVINPPEEEVQNTLDHAKRKLEELGFGAQAVANAVRQLTQSTHKQEIEAICERVGLPPDSEAAQAWKWIAANQYRQTHWRSFWEMSPLAAVSTLIDQFDLVVQQVIGALERRYGAFFQQIDRLAAGENPTAAVKSFAKEIPLSPVLQDRFYNRIPVSRDWIDSLVANGLFSDRPLVTHADSENMEPSYAPWRQRIYLVKAAGSGYKEMREVVATIVRTLASTRDLAVRDSCAAAISQLPAAEAAPFEEVFISWLEGPVTWGTSSAAAEFVKVTNRTETTDAAFPVARALFHLEPGDAERTMSARFGSGQYALHLKEIAPGLIRLDANRAFNLFIDLLVSALRFSGLVERDKDLDRSVSHFQSGWGHGLDGYEEAEALAQVVRDAAISAAVNPPVTKSVVCALRAPGIRLLDQLALDIAVEHIDEITDIVDEMLTNATLLGAWWCQAQYIKLARGRLPGAPPALTDAVVNLAYSLPNRFQANWERSRLAMRSPRPTVRELDEFRAMTILGLLSGFKDLLPPYVQENLDEASREFRPASEIVSPPQAAGTDIAHAGKFDPLPIGSVGELLERARRISVHRTVYLD